MRMLDGHVDRRSLARGREAKSDLGASEIPAAGIITDIGSPDSDDIIRMSQQFRSVPYRYNSAEHFNRVEAQIANGGVIAIVEPCLFMRECIERSLEDVFLGEVSAYATVDDLIAQMSEIRPSIVMLSSFNGTEEAIASDLSMITAADATVRIVVLADKDDLGAALNALRHGAKGYIPMTTGLHIAAEAMRFIIAGGSYISPECVVASKSPGASEPQTTMHAGISGRELAVIRAIRQGKPNKVIAYELNLCESTVKVHVRHIMKKLRAKNRTDLAIKSTELLTRLSA